MMTVEHTGKVWLSLLKERLARKTLICTSSGYPNMFVVGAAYIVQKDFTLNGYYLDSIDCTRFKLKELLIDWEKPLVVASWPKPEVTKVGVSTKGEILLESSRGVIYKANPLTGAISGNESCKVTNKAEPWLEAFDRWQGQPEEQDYSVKKTFEAGFQAGIDYALGTVK
jgi:hypothetical protein